MSLIKRLLQFSNTETFFIFLTFLYYACVCQQDKLEFSSSHSFNSFTTF